MISVGSGRYEIRLATQMIGKDRLVIITGGEEEHIGAATLMDKRGMQNLKKQGHEDHLLSEKTARVIFDTMGEDLLVLCGIHIDNARKEEISLLIQNTQKCVDMFLKEQS